MPVVRAVGIELNGGDRDGRRFLAVSRMIGVRSTLANVNRFGLSRRFFCHSTLLAITVGGVGTHTAAKPRARFLAVYLKLHEL